MRTLLIAAATLALSGCASTYNLSVMPRDSGKMYSGTAHDTGRGEGPISITIEGTAYNGTWVQATPERATAYVSGGFGFRRWGLGSMVTFDNPYGAQAKALLTAANGAGLRCDLRTDHGRGGGVCRDDKGREYDVQVRLAERR